jgi:hypothetical protein
LAKPGVAQSYRGEGFCLSIQKLMASSQIVVAKKTSWMNPQVISSFHRTETFLLSRKTPMTWNQITDRTGLTSDDMPRTRTEKCRARYVDR